MNIELIYEAFFRMRPPLLLSLPLSISHRPVKEDKQTDACDAMGARGMSLIEQKESLRIFKTERVMMGKLAL